ncbi:c-type cytochrome biogenesis protein CcmI [Parashewanella spongiae]|uniref:C-type cytochrome biogenesis protein CcmI n=2 Tax=Parashewanella spongiae TaxID=342950 RepID=A0A3A6TPD8_9GAMM|nr:c-type cytochrome biogenesis protein CcmI [Parashewanella spongiae]
MTTFWIVIAIFILVSFTLIWFPFIKKSSQLQPLENIRHQANLTLFNEKLSVLEKEHRDNQIDEQEFLALKKELEITLLQDVQQAPEHAQASTSSKSPIWPLLMSFTVLAVAGVMYNKLGSYEILNQTPQLAQSHESMSQEQIFEQQLSMMQQQVNADPKDSETWFSLGHAYISLGRYTEAVKAFDQAIAVDGETAELLGPKATALFYQAGQQMTPEIQAIIDKSLALDSSDPATLLLVGMSAFFNSEYQQAINAWQKILNSERQDIDRSAVTNAISEAKKRLKGNTDEVALSHASITVEVSIAPELASQAEITDTLYLFVRTSGDKIVPIAATKLVSAQLPLTVELNQSNELGTGVSLNDVSQVDVVALLSKDGKLKPKAGDLQGRLTKVEVGSQVRLVLDTRVSK